MTRQRRQPIRPRGHQHGQTHGSQVPEGNAADVLAWVANSPKRAALAAKAEQAREKPRSTVLAALEKVQEGAPST